MMAIYVQNLTCHGTNDQINDQQMMNFMLCFYFIMLDFVKIFCLICIT